MIGRKFVHFARDASAEGRTLCSSIVDEIRISDDSDNEILLRWRLIAGRVVGKLEIQDDSWQALASMSDVVDMLGQIPAEELTPENVCLNLHGLNIEDRTVEVEPALAF